jgi:hypothetical protein
VPETNFTDDGLLEVKRDHQMVNQYNQSMAVGLRHNIDISPNLTRKKGLALMHYICNYASKLNAPMWKRLAYAEELLDLARQQGEGPGVPGTTRCGEAPSRATSGSSHPPRVYTTCVASELAHSKSKVDLDLARQQCI